MTDKGVHVRLGAKKLSKGEKKLLKKFKRDVRNGKVQLPEGRPVPPHRSGGGLPLTFGARSAKVSGLDLGEVEITMLPPAMGKPAPVRRLTQRAREDREAFEEYFGDSGCTCFQNAPCSFCTHPGNPHNQEDESCYIEAVPQVVAFDPKRTVLSGEPSPFAGFVLEGCVGCEFCDRCVNEEAVLRHYQGCGDTQAPAMDVAQREWCLKEIDAMEGYSRDDFEAVPDKELANAVLCAWADYARDKGVL